MRDGKEEGVYIISVAARLAEVHPQTLRLYERKGLLCPERTPKNRRRYSESDIERLRHIQVLTREEGLNLSGVSKVLRMEDEISRLRNIVTELETEMARADGHLQQRVVTRWYLVSASQARTARSPANALRSPEAAEDHDRV